MLQAGTMQEAPPQQLVRLSRPSCLEDAGPPSPSEQAEGIAGALFALFDALHSSSRQPEAHHYSTLGAVISTGKARDSVRIGSSLWVSPDPKFHFPNAWPCCRFQSLTTWRWVRPSGHGLVGRAQPRSCLGRGRFRSLFALTNSLFRNVVEQASAALERGPLARNSHWLAHHFTCHWCLQQVVSPTCFSKSSASR